MAKSNKSNRDNFDKVYIGIEPHLMECITVYMLTTPAPDLRFLRNIHKLFTAIDERVFERNDYDYDLHRCILQLVKMRMEGTTEMDYLLAILAQRGISSDMIKQLRALTEKLNISFDNFKHLSTEVTHFLSYIAINKYKPHSDKFYEDFSLDTFQSLPAKMSTFKKHLEEVIGELRSLDTVTDSDVDLGGDLNEDKKLSLINAYNKITDPSNVYKTGSKALNLLLNGGFRRQRMYMVYGPTGGFKSGFMLHIALWSALFNPQAKPVFPGRKLCIMVLNFENSEIDTRQRLFAIHTAGRISEEDVSLDTYLAIWSEIYTRMDTNIILKIKHLTREEATFEGVRAKKREVEQDLNCEVIMVIADHLGNMRPSASTMGMAEHTKFTEVAYEGKDFCNSEDVVLIVAKHTSPEFKKQLVEARREGKQNLVRMATEAAIGDARNIDRAVDASLYIVNEVNPLDGRSYLGIKNDKIRMKRAHGDDTFFHEMTNGILLQADLHLDYSLSHRAIPGSEGMGMGGTSGMPNMFDNDPFGTVKTNTFQFQTTQQNTTITPGVDLSSIFEFSPAPPKQAPIVQTPYVIPDVGIVSGDEEEDDDYEELCNIEEHVLASDLSDDDDDIIDLYATDH